MIHFKIIKNITELGHNVFLHCRSLSSIDVVHDNPSFTNIDGNLFSKDKTSIVVYPEGKIQEEYTLPSETINIESGAFANARIHVLRVENTLKKIDQEAFEYSRDLREIHLRVENPKDLSIERNAFKHLKDCTLYVPLGTGYAYRHDGRFNEFKEIIIER